MATFPNVFIYHTYKCWYPSGPESNWQVQPRSNGVCLWGFLLIPFNALCSTLVKWCLPNLLLGRSYLDLVNIQILVYLEKLSHSFWAFFVGQREKNSASGSCIERTMLLDMYSRDNLILAGDWAESFRHVMWLLAENSQRREARWWRRLGNMILRRMVIGPLSRKAAEAP